ncbi:MAG: hypothetical protein QOH52_459 [Pseudonocardiales bacterium]|nr:hypothetical protein [Pseudonocardiales bacterium]
MRRSGYVLISVALGAGVVGLSPTGAAANDQDHASKGPSKPVVVVSGLNNPRQLSLVDSDELLIAEAGKGGPTPITTPEGGPSGVGGTGSISAVYRPQRAHDTSPHRIVTGLMSIAAPDGSFAIGSDGVSARSEHGPIYIQETYAPPDLLPAPFNTKQDGRLLSARPYSSHLKVVANISRFEKTDPDGKGFDSDPYAVLALRGGELVADAAGNDVLWVHGKHVSLFHVFPNVRTGPCASQFDPDPTHPGCNFVPTSLATDRHGHVYVGGLVSEVPGQGRVVELSSDGRHVLHVWSGFTTVTGVAVGHDGALYVSQLLAPEAAPPNPQVAGVLTRVSHGKRTNVDVPFPAGVVVNDDNQVFVSAWSVASEAGLAGPSTSGQVWRLRF